MLVDDQRPAAALGAPAETAGSAQGHGDAPWIFKPEFPNGLRPRVAGSEGKELCGLHALKDSLPRQHPGHKRPTIRELKNTTDSPAYADCFPIGVPPIKAFFTVDALAMVLHCWAREHSPGRGYTLVICQRDGSESHRFPQADIDEAQQSNLYISYQRGEGHAGHYSSLVPATARERDAKEKSDREAREKEQRADGNSGLAHTWKGDVLEEHSQIPMLKVGVGLAVGSDRRDC